jgi:hypothetical protein
MPKSLAFVPVSVLIATPLVAIACSTEGSNGSPADAGPADSTVADTGAEAAASDGTAEADGAPDASTPDVAQAPDASGDGALDSAADSPEVSTGSDAASCAADAATLATDPHNCGACGHDCLGSSCGSGECAPTILYDRGVHPGSLALDDVNAYFTDWGANQVVQVPKDSVADSGTALVLATSSVIPGGGIAVLGSYVYWSADAIYKTPIGGGTSVPLVHDPYVQTLAVDGVNVYYVTTTAGFGAPLSGLPDGGTPPIFLGATPHYANNLQVNATTAYWVAAGDPPYTAGVVLSAPVTGLPDGGSATPLATAQPEPQGLAIDGTDAFWANTGDGTIRKAPLTGLDGGRPPILASGAYVVRVATDGVNVYYIDSAAGDIWRVSVDGGVPVHLASKQSNPSAIAVDARYVYWANYNDGTVARVAK